MTRDCGGQELKSDKVRLERLPEADGQSAASNSFRWAECRRQFVVMGGLCQQSVLMGGVPSAIRFNGRIGGQELESDKVRLEKLPEADDPAILEQRVAIEGRCIF